MPSSVIPIPVPLLDLQAQYAQIKDEIERAVLHVLASQHFILGPEVEALEREVANYSQCQYAIGVSSGTDALLAALMAIDIKPDDEVITTPYSFFATVGAIARLGAKPVFVDINPFTYNIDSTKVAAAITSKTKAIIPVHLYGQMADLEPLMQLAAHHNIYVIEDAAQAIGAELHGKRAGSVGHLSCFSFFPSKNLGGVGDGGMVTTNDPQLAEKVRLLRGHGAKPKYFHKIIGGNFRLDAIQAAVLRIKLKYLDNWTAARQANAEAYRALLSQAGMVIDGTKLSCLANQCASLSTACQLRNGVVPPTELPTARHIYNQFVIRVSHRDKLIRYLKDNNIGSEIYYPVPLHLQECFASLGYQAGALPVAECAAQSTLALPIYPELTPTHLQSVVKVLAAGISTITNETT